MNASTLKTSKAQSSKAKRSLLTASAILALTISQITYAQDNPLVGPAPPPSIETNSPGGVDMSTGRFAYESTDMSIGESCSLRLCKARVVSVHIIGPFSSFITTVESMKCYSVKLSL